MALMAAHLGRQDSLHELRDNDIGHFEDISPYRPRASAGTLCAATVIAIPDFDGEPTAATWTTGDSTCWLPQLEVDHLSCAIILSYEHGINLKHNFTWRDLPRYGDGLMAALQQRLITRELRDQPLVFICHGFGGLLFKRMMGVLHERFYTPASRALLQVIAGAVFLGCPSPVAHRPRDLKAFASLVKAVSGMGAKGLDRLQASCSVAVTISEKFSDCGFDAPLLSVYEQKVTRIGKNIFSPREITVDQPLCETLTRRERVIGANCSHDGLTSMSPHGGAERLMVEMGSLISLALELHRDRRGREGLVQQLAITKAIHQDPLDALNDQFNRTSLRHDRSSSSTLVTAPAPWLAGINRRDSDMQLTDYLGDDQMSRHVYPQPAGDIAFPVHSLGPHPRPAACIGRELVLAKVDDVLLPPDGNTVCPRDAETMRSFALCGMGGVGKTTVAVEYVHSRQQHFDAIFWLNAVDPNRLASDFAHVAELLHLTDNGGMGDQRMLRQSVLKWLLEKSRTTRAGHERRINWLLVFDNVERLGDLEGYWPTGAANGAILMTSRDPLVKTKTFYAGNQGMDLHPLNFTDAAAWLRDLTQSTGEEDIVSSELIVEKLSCNPLAIVQIASAIQSKHLSLAEFLDFYSTETFRNKIYQQPTTQLEGPIWTVFAFDSLDPVARRILDILCFLSPDGIPESFFQAPFKNSQQDLPLPSRLYGFPSDGIEFMEARARLIKSSLITRHLERKECTIHRIVQATAIAHMSTERLIECFQIALHMVLLTWPLDQCAYDFDKERWAKCVPLLPHVQHLLQQYEETQCLQESSEMNTNFAHLLGQAGWILGERRASPATLHVHRTAKRMALSASSIDYVVVWMAQLNLANHGFAESNFEMALDSSKECVRIVENHPEVTTRRLPFGLEYITFNVLSESLMNLRRWEDAMVSLKRASDARVKDGTGLSPGLNTISLAHCLWRLGKSDEAWEILTEYISRRDSYPQPEEGYKVVWALAEQGSIRKAQNREEESFKFYEDAYHMCLDILPFSHVRSGALAKQLADHYFHKGDFGKASIYLKQCLQIYNQHSHRNPEIIRALFLLAQTQELIGETTAAAEGRDRAGRMLLDLSLETGRRLKQADLEDMVAYWAC